MSSDHAQAASLRRLASAIDSSARFYVGIPVDLHAVQIRCESHGWPEWIDVTENVRRAIAEEQADAIRQAAVEAELDDLQVRVFTRRVLS